MVPAKVESLLIEEFNPDFLYLDEIEKNSINVIISSNCFINKNIETRVRSVYALFEKKYPEFFDTHTLFVSTLTLEELNNSFDFFLEEQNEKT